MQDERLLNVIKVWAVVMLIAVSALVILVGADTAWRVLFK